MDHPLIPSAFDTWQDRADAAAFLTSARATIASSDAWAPRRQWAAAMRIAARRAGCNAVWLDWTALDASVGPNFTAFEWAADTTHEVMLRVFDLAIQRLSAPDPAEATDAPDIALPAEELTRAMLDAAFAETRRMMAERGVTEDGIALFMAQAVNSLWGDEDREDLRAKAHAAASAYVDALFDALGDERVAA